MFKETGRKACLHAKLQAHSIITYGNKDYTIKKEKLAYIIFPQQKFIPRPHWVVDKQSSIKIHQASLFFLPHDTVRLKTHRYALVVVDIASRYKDAEALTSKESKEMTKTFTKIYSTKLRWPNNLMVDTGK